MSYTGPSDAWYDPPEDPRGDAIERLRDQVPDQCPTCGGTTAASEEAGESKDLPGFAKHVSLSDDDHDLSITCLREPTTEELLELVRDAAELYLVGTGRVPNDNPDSDHFAPRVRQENAKLRKVLHYRVGLAGEGQCDDTLAELRCGCRDCRGED